MPGPILIGLYVGQLAGRDTDEHEARATCPFQICITMTGKGQQLFVCFGEIVKFSNRNITSRFGTYYRDLHASQIWLGSYHKNRMTETNEGELKTGRGPPAIG